MGNEICVMGAMRHEHEKRNPCPGSEQDTCAKDMRPAQEIDQRHLAVVQQREGNEGEHQAGQNFEQRAKRVGPEEGGEQRAEGEVREAD